jgi:hypothetical protein
MATGIDPACGLALPNIVGLQADRTFELVATIGSENTYDKG